MSRGLQMQYDKGRTVAKSAQQPNYAAVLQINREITPQKVAVLIALLDRADVLSQETAEVMVNKLGGTLTEGEARQALEDGCHVMMFSDNVSIEQELELKTIARARGLLVMGPDCGTAIIGGVPLGFANAVRRGSIGLVAASGTGLQEVSTQIHRMGGGISHAIGTGGRDVYDAVGGATMLQGIALLAQDAATKVIVIVSKPPGAVVAARVLGALQATGKPSIVLFLGHAATLPKPAKGSLVRVAHTLVDCAALAVKLAGVRRSTPPVYELPKKPVFGKGQKYLRALFSGGTFAAEAQLLWAAAGLNVWSNVTLNK